jgi:hypothetical protein
MSPCDKVHLEQAATLLIRKPRSAEDAVRIANSVQRLLASVALRRGRQPIAPLRERLAAETSS